MTRAQSEYLFVGILGLMAMFVLGASGIAHPSALIAASILGFAVGICACGFSHG